MVVPSWLLERAPTLPPLRRGRSSLRLCARAARPVRVDPVADRQFQPLVNRKVHRPVRKKRKQSRRQPPVQPSRPLFPQNLRKTTTNALRGRRTALHLEPRLQDVQGAHHRCRDGPRDAPCNRGGDLRVAAQPALHVFGKVVVVSERVVEVVAAPACGRLDSQSFEPPYRVP